MKDFGNRVAVVTGGGSGIGRATALALAERGCRVAVADISADGADETVSLILERSGVASAHRCDVSDRASVEQLAAEVIDTYGECNVLVNNAGVTTAGRFEEESSADIEWLVSINLWGVVYGCQTFLPLIREAGAGHIVNLSSMVGLMGLPGNSVYSLSKGAVRSFSEALRAELRGQRIGVTVIHPGAIRTGIVEASRGAEADRLRRLDRMWLRNYVMGSPEKVATAIVTGIERDRARMIVGPDARLLDTYARLVPSRIGLLGRAINRLT